MSLILGCTAILTAVWPEWIEAIFGVELDRGDGSLEWAIVLALAIGALVAAIVARRSMGHARNAAAGS